MPSHDKPKNIAPLEDREPGIVYEYAPAFDSTAAKEKSPTKLQKKKKPGLSLHGLTDLPVASPTKLQKKKKPGLSLHGLADLPVGRSEGFRVSFDMVSAAGAPDSPKHVEINAFSPVAERALLFPNDSGTEVGKGAFGTVSRVHDAVVRKEVTSVTDTEYQMLCALGFHENIIRTSRRFSSKTGFGFFLPYYDLNSLDHYAQKIEPVLHQPEAQSFVYQVLRQAAAGLAFVHSKGVIHHDVKPGNILLNSIGGVVIADFGCAGKALDIAKDPTPGTVRYFSPEKILVMLDEGDKEQLYTVDVWSLGLIMRELLGLPNPLGDVPPRATIGDLCGLASEYLSCKEVGIEEKFADQLSCLKRLREGAYSEDHGRGLIILKDLTEAMALPAEIRPSSAEIYALCEKYEKDFTISEEQRSVFVDTVLKGDMGAAQADAASGHSPGPVR